MCIFKAAITAKRWVIDMWLLLYMNRKSYVGIPMTSLYQTLSDLDRLNSKSLIFRSLTSHKRAQRGRMLLLNIDGKPYMESPVPPSYLTLSWTSRSLRFQSLISWKWAELRHMLLLNINRKLYIGNPMVPWHLTLSELERSNLGSLNRKEPS